MLSRRVHRSAITSRAVSNVRSVPNWLWWLLAALVLGGGGVAAVYMTRGLRNNNPGNIKLTNQNWLGKVTNSQNTDGTFEQFISMDYGVRALSRVLNSYSNRGLNTVRSIITTFSATDQEAYVSNVSEALGVDPDDLINVADPDTKAALIRAIIRQEQGVVPALAVTDAQIETGIALA